eukprot:PLAT5399.4.p1 GENE.PLAT5399.4~~PLAT5399.4.p1  ORF type:complete len:469 (-),score=119.19 PLAT5399.4:17-1300(-)
MESVLASVRLCCKKTYANYLKGPNLLVTAALLVLILSRAMDQTIFYRLSYQYENYLWYLASVVVPMGFLCISWPIVWWKLVHTDDITPQMRAFPFYKYAIMGLLDTSYNILSTWPVPYLGGPLSNVLSQVVLPFNMLGSLCFLRTKYLKVHYIGAILVIYGVMVKLIPDLFFNKSGRTALCVHDCGGWIVLLILAQVPAAASNVYKEIALKDAAVDMDVWYLNAWIAIFQLFWGLLSFPLISVGAVNHNPRPVAALFSYIRDATTCFFGQNAIAADTHCSGTIWVFLVFLMFNFTYNQLMLYVFKAGSSVLFVVASAVRLPLVDLLLLSSFVAGPSRAFFTVYDGFALFILVLAIFIYYSEKEQRWVDSVAELDDSAYYTHVDAAEEEAIIKAISRLPPSRGTRFTAPSARDPLITPKAHSDYSTMS